MLMNCRNKTSEFCICTVTVIGPKWALLCALSLKHFFLCIFFSAPSLKNYNLVSPPNPAEVCDVDFGLRPSYWSYMGGCPNIPSAMEKNISRLLENVPFVGRDYFPAMWVLRSALAFWEDSISLKHRDHGRTRMCSHRGIFLDLHRQTTDPYGRD